MVLRVIAKDTLNISISAGLCIDTQNLSGWHLEPVFTVLNSDGKNKTIYNATFSSQTCSHAATKSQNSFIFNVVTSSTLVKNNVFRLILTLKVMHCRDALYIRILLGGFLSRN